jgi:TPP-dependent pyruvate/acetoin dehydrogenase alpha subunit
MIVKQRQQADSPPSGQNGFSLISNHKLIQLYSTMLRCRMLDECIRILVELGKLPGIYQSAHGHEAATVGVAIDLASGDTVAPSMRGFIVSFIQGVPLEKIFARLHAGSQKKRSANARLNIATAAARAAKEDKNNWIAVAFSEPEPGSGATHAFQQAMHFAGLHRLPMVFVCQANLQPGSETDLLQNQPEDLTHPAHAHAFPRITVDGNDIVAVYRVAFESIQRVRLGRGPTLIECRRWVAADPILNMENYLAQKGLFRADLKSGIAAAFNIELDRAIRAAFPGARSTR